MRNIFKSRFVIILTTLIFLYTFLGFVLAPYLIQKNFSTIIKSNTSANGYLSKVYINPYTFELELTNLLLQDKQNLNLIYFNKFSIDFKFTSIFQKVLVLQNIYLYDFKTNIILDKNKVANFQYILDFLNKKSKNEIKSTKKTTPQIVVKINNINFKDNRITFIDNSKSLPFEINTKKFNINIQNLSLIQNDRGTLDVKINITNTANLQINSTFSLNPVALDGTLILDNLRIDKISTYIKDDIDFELSGDKIDLNCKYKLSINNDTLDLNLQDINTFVKGIKYKKENLSVNLISLTNQIKQINIKKQDKNIDLAVENIIIKDTNLTFNDLSKKRSVKLNINNINAKVNKITLDKSLPISFEFSLDTPYKGTIATKGDVIIEPLTTNIQLNTQNISFVPYNPYIKDYININLKSALLNSKLDIKLKTKKKQLIQDISGNITLHKVNIEHKQTKKQLLSLKKLAIKKLKYINNNLNIDNILIDSARTKFIIAKDKTTNFDNIMPKTTQKVEKESKTKFNYFVKNLKIKQGYMNFADFSLPLAFSTKVHSLNANIQAISSKNINTKINLNGKVDKYGLANIKGVINTANFKKKSDISINFENLDLISVSPYSGKFIGNKISSGKLWLDLNYKIKDSNLTSTNRIKIKDLELGDKIDSNESVNLPIGLAIALLEDSDGFIDVDVPVGGDIDNPEFKLSGAIWSAVGNVITNIITAPFRFLASLLGLDSNELGYIDFDYGSAILLAPQIEKLDKLVMAIKKKPKLSLLLKPSYDEINDKIALQQIEFEALTNKKDKDDIIEELYIKQFGEDKYDEIEDNSKDEELFDILSAQLIPTIKIEKNSLEQLALNRAKNIQLYVLSKEISKEKVTISQEINISTKENEKRFIMNLDIEIKK